MAIVRESTQLSSRKSIQNSAKKSKRRTPRSKHNYSIEGNEGHSIKSTVSLMLGEVFRDDDSAGFNESDISLTSSSCFDISSDGSLAKSDEKKKMLSPGLPDMKEEDEDSSLL